MTQNVPLEKGDVALEPFFDATQEMLSSGASGFRLVPISNVAIRAEAGAGHDQAAISIAGNYRYRTTSIDAAHPGGAAGSYDVYVTGTANDFTGPDPDIDLTDYNFGLAIRAVGSPPTGVAHFRKVGEVVWDGSKITRLKQLVASARRDGETRHLVAPLPGFVPEVVQGASGQTANLSEWLANDGTILAYVDAGGDASFAGGGGFSELAVTGAGGKDTLALSSTGADTGLTIGGDTTLYRPAANVLATDDELRVVRAAAGDVAFSAWVAGDMKFLAQADGSLEWGSIALYPSGGGLRLTGGPLDVDGNLNTDGALTHSGGTVGFFGVTPAGRSTGWGTFVRSDGSSATTRKTLPQAYTMDMVVDVLWTMKEALVLHGLWGPP